MPWRTCKPINECRRFVARLLEGQKPSFDQAVAEWVEEQRANAA